MSYPQEVSKVNRLLTDGGGACADQGGKSDYLVKTKHRDGRRLVLTQCGFYLAML